jgi:type 1 glutamine amidotransferase
MRLLRSAFAIAVLSLACAAFGADKKIILIAGKPSHGPGEHEFRAGCLLLNKCLEKVPGVSSVVYSNGWPREAGAFEGAAAVLIYADGGPGHPAIQADHATVLEALLKTGVGFGCAHYGVEVPRTNGGPAFLDWLGGYYEDHFSVNPMWSPDFSAFPDHPITRGVKPFSIRDEWYFNLRFRPDAKASDASLEGVAKSIPDSITPILHAKPSDAVRRGPYVYPKGPYEHIIAASGRDEVMMWAYERAGGGRSFGFTGGHYHTNWANADFRKGVLNALLWIGKAEVPPDGVQSAITPEELKENLDRKR